MRAPKLPLLHDAAASRSARAARALVDKVATRGVVDLDDFAAQAPPRTKKGVRSASAREIESAIAEADDMRARGAWAGAAPRHLVALYALCHEHVYGVRPGELAGKTWSMACAEARRFLDREFGGDVARCVEFVAWAWQRERRATRRASDTDRRRIGWRLMFSAALATDYRVAVASRRSA